MIVSYIYESFLLLLIEIIEQDKKKKCFKCFWRITGHFAFFKKSISTVVTIHLSKNFIVTGLDIVTHHYWTPFHHQKQQIKQQQQSSRVAPQHN